MDNSIAEEERILRVWTPILLRTILVAAIVLLLAGLIVMAWHNPGQYVARFHRLQSHTRYENRQSLAYLASTAIGGNSPSIMPLGLLLLRLVRLVRVPFGFCSFSGNVTASTLC